MNLQKLASEPNTQTQTHNGGDDHDDVDHDDDDEDHEIKGSKSLMDTILAHKTASDDAGDGSGPSPRAANRLDFLKQQRKQVKLAQAPQKRTISDHERAEHKRKILEELGHIAAGTRMKLKDKEIEDRENEIKANDTGEDIAQFTSVSYLDPSIINWVQKRKPTSLRAFVSPSQAIHLRSIFRGLDFDRSGELSLEELIEAVHYVSTTSSSSSKDPLFESPQKLTKLFRDMDIDGNGTVDFNEFLIAMTSEGNGEANSMRLQNAFYEFANKHNRQKMIDKINDSQVSVLERYEEFHKLARIRFIKDDKKDDTLEDPHVRVAEEVKRQKEEMQSESRKKLIQTEVARSRIAAIGIKQKRGSLARLEPLKSSSMEIAVKSMHIPDAEHVAKQLTRKVTERLSDFGVHDKVEYAPSLTPNRSMKDIKMDAIFDHKALKKSNSTKSCLLPPPKSVREIILDRVEHSRPQATSRHRHGDNRNTASRHHS